MVSKMPVSRLKDPIAFDGDEIESWNRARYAAGCRQQGGSKQVSAIQVSLTIARPFATVQSQACNPAADS
jgi:hypothetical protein